MTRFGARHRKGLGLLASGQSLFLASTLLAQPTQTGAIGPSTTSTPRPAFVNTADLASSTAVEVITDVQSVHFWSRFQRGEINGFPYVLFPDGLAKVYSNQEPQVLLITMTCTHGVSCSLNPTTGPNLEVPATGAEKPSFPDVADASAIAVYLAEWVLAGSGTPSVLETSQDAQAKQVSFEPDRSDPIVIGENPTKTVADLTLVTGEAQENPLVQVVLETEDEGETEPDLSVDEVCPEQAQFVPTSCAQPPVQLQRTATVEVREVDVAPDVSVAPINAPNLSFSEQYKLRCSLTGTTSLSYAPSDGQIQRPGKPRASLGCSASFTDQLSMRVSLIRYVNPDQQEDFDPDFTYALTYRINDAVSLGYANYGGRFSGADGGLSKAIENGNLRASFRLPKIVLPNDKTIACSASVELPNPLDASGNVSCGYSINSKFRIAATSYFYMPDEQTEFQPDFSYTASYQLADNWLLSYSNYANNRWPWNQSGATNPGIGGGSLAVSYTFDF